LFGRATMENGPACGASGRLSDSVRSSRWCVKDCGPAPIAGLAQLALLSQIFGAFFAFDGLDALAYNGMSS
jgi:hypothetical protein